MITHAFDVYRGEFHAKCDPYRGTNGRNLYGKPLLSSVQAGQTHRCRSNSDTGNSGTSGTWLCAGWEA